MLASFSLYYERTEASPVRTVVELSCMWVEGPSVPLATLSRSSRVMGRQPAESAPASAVLAALLAAQEEEGRGDGEVDNGAWEGDASGEEKGNGDEGRRRRADVADRTSYGTVRMPTALLVEQRGGDSAVQAAHQADIKGQKRAIHRVVATAGYRKHEGRVGGDDGSAMQGAHEVGMTMEASERGGVGRTHAVTTDQNATVTSLLSGLSEEEPVKKRKPWKRGSKLDGLKMELVRVTCCHEVAGFSMFPVA